MAKSLPTGDTCDFCPLWRWFIRPLFRIRIIRIISNQLKPKWRMKREYDKTVYFMLCRCKGEVISDPQVSPTPEPDTGFWNPVKMSRIFDVINIRILPELAQIEYLPILQHEHLHVDVPKLFTEEGAEVCCAAMPALVRTYAG